MTVITSPRERQCERCDRCDVWDDADSTWRIAVEDGEKQSGNPHCLHEWDINGNFQPVDS